MLRHNFDEIVNRRGEGGVKWNSFPEDVLPMWIADSDFRSPREVIEALKARIDHGVFGYVDLGNPAFAEACAGWMQARFGWKADPAWVEFTPGVCAGLAICVSAFTRPGDHIVILTPTYPPFYGIPHENGRHAISCPLLNNGSGDYQIDFADLEAKLSHERARALFLCNPQNPTGRVFTRAELLRIGELCLKHQVLVVSDEIHCDYAFLPHRHIPFPSLAPELAEISVVAINPSKTFNIADFHTSALIASNPKLRNQIRAAVCSAHLGGHSLGLLAATTAYTRCAYYADQVIEYTRANLEFAVEFINRNIPAIKAYMPQSTYVLWLDCSGLGLSSQAGLMNLFLEKGRLALNSGTDYGPEGYQFARINLACPRSLAEEGLLRLKLAVDAV